MDQRKAQEKNFDNVVLKATYPAYRFVYLVYRKLVNFAGWLALANLHPAD
jgi:hypothetical protein